jgi:hypothetical protein
VKSEEPFVLVQRLVNNDGAFQLLTLIEGADANQQFKKNLDIVRVQRIALKKLNEQTDKTDEVKQKIEGIEKKLKENTDLRAPPATSVGGAGKNFKRG